MYYLIPKKVQLSEEQSAMRKFQLVLQISKRIRAGEITGKNEIDTLLESNSFTLNEKIGLNWMAHTI